MTSGTNPSGTLNSTAVIHTPLRIETWETTMRPRIGLRRWAQSATRPPTNWATAWPMRITAKTIGARPWGILALVHQPGDEIGRP